MHLRKSKAGLRALFLLWFYCLSNLGLVAQRPQLGPGPEAQHPLSTLVTIFVSEFRFTGNTVFSGEQLSKVVTNWTHRVIGSDGLEDARRALTLYYVNHGYISSGAVVDDQPVKNGVITFRIVEGKLSEVHVHPTNNWLRPGYIRSRVLLGAGPPLNMSRLQERLLMLRDNPNVARINAELGPGTAPGESILNVQLREKSPWRLAFEVRDDRPPSVGESIMEVQASHQDLTGHSDPLEVRWGIVDFGNNTAKFSSLDDFGVAYGLPLTARDTALRLSYDRNNYAVIQEPFNSLGIESETESFLVALRQPLYRTPSRELAVMIEGNWRQSRSFLSGQPFSFSPGAVEGEQTVSVLRFVQEYIDRGQQQVLALRSSLNIGLDVLDATRNETHPDGRFISWLGQAQYARRLADTANQLILSTSFQWADNPLLALEQFSFGGPNTVRGYEQNQLVRDMGLIGTVEFRIPVIFSRGETPVVQLAPFADAGTGWNVDRRTPSPSDIMSAGIGILWTPGRRFSAQLYWGYAFRDLNQGRSNLQDFGLNFKLRVLAF